MSNKTLFCSVLFCIITNDPVSFIFHFVELHIGSSIRYETTLFGNYFLKYYKVKRILMSFNCFLSILNSPLLQVYFPCNWRDANVTAIYKKKKKKKKKPRQIYAIK